MGWGIVGDIAGGIKDTVTDGYDAVTDTVSDGFDWVSDRASDGFNWVSDRASDGLGWLGDQAKGFADKVGDALSWLSDRASSWINGLLSPLRWMWDALNWVFDGLKAWFNGWMDTVKLLLRGFNAPATLQETADAWQSGPVANLQGLEETISQQTLLADEGWNSPAGQAYAQTIPGQVAAVAGVRELANNTSTVLKDTATSLKSLYAEGGGIIGKVYAAINGSPGELFSVETLLEIVGLDHDQLIEVCNAVKEFAETAQAQKEKLAAQATNLPAFPGGDWPKAALG